MAFPIFHPMRALIRSAQATRDFGPAHLHGSKVEKVLKLSLFQNFNFQMA
jgi:hypothetical protein